MVLAPPMTYGSGLVGGCVDVFTYSQSRDLMVLAPPVTYESGLVGGCVDVFTYSHSRDLMVLTHPSRCSLTVMAAI
jgi:hypothetical protein